MQKCIFIHTPAHLSSKHIVPTKKKKRLHRKAKKKMKINILGFYSNYTFKIKTLLYVRTKIN